MAVTVRQSVRIDRQQHRLGRGAAVEWVSVPGGGWPAIEKEFVGSPSRFLGSAGRVVRYWNASPALVYKQMDMPAGITEDGAEIRYLLALALMKKDERITVDDLAEVWKREIVREDIGHLVNPHQAALGPALCRR